MQNHGSIHTLVELIFWIVIICARRSFLIFLENVLSLRSLHVFSFVLGPMTGRRECWELAWIGHLWRGWPPDELTLRMLQVTFVVYYFHVFLIQGKLCHMLLLGSDRIFLRGQDKLLCLCLGLPWCLQPRLTRLTRTMLLRRRRRSALFLLFCLLLAKVHYRLR